MPTGKPQDLRAVFTPRGTSRNLRTAAGTLKPKCTPGLSLPRRVGTSREHAPPPGVFDKCDDFGSCRVLSKRSPRWGREVSLTSANSRPGRRGELKGRAERRKSQSLAKKSPRLSHILALSAPGSRGPSFTLSIKADLPLQGTSPSLQRTRAPGEQLPTVLPGASSPSQDPRSLKPKGSLGKTSEEGL